METFAQPCPQNRLIPASMPGDSTVLLRVVPQDTGLARVLQRARRRHEPSTSSGTQRHTLLRTVFSRVGVLRPHQGQGPRWPAQGSIQTGAAARRAAGSGRAGSEGRRLRGHAGLWSQTKGGGLVPPVQTVTAADGRSETCSSPVQGTGRLSVHVSIRDGGQINAYGCSWEVK